MKFFIQSILIYSIIQNVYSAELNCQSVGNSSCNLNNGSCIEFLPIPNVPTSMIQQYCESSEGIFSNSPCDESFKAKTCINQNNPLLPIVRFNTDANSQMMTQICLAMGGMFCQ